jgi:GTPase SAR1 family protein
MLSLRGKEKDEKCLPIAAILDKFDTKIKTKDLKKIFIKGDLYQDIDDLVPELQTTKENKMSIFKKHISLYKKLSKKERDSIISDYSDNKEESTNDKLQRIYEDGLVFVKRSLCCYLDFGLTEDLFPIIEDISKKSARIMISGQSGSGKSYWISQFCKYNTKKTTPIFIFSPFKRDKSLDGIKQLIYLDLDEFEDENGRKFEMEDLEEDCVCIFDDIDSHATKAKELQKLRDICLQRGRHHGDAGITTITVSHNPMGNEKTKASLRESNYFVLFPRANERDVEKLLLNYCKYSAQQIAEVLAARTRWVFISKLPRYFVGEHSIRLF